MQSSSMVCVETDLVSVCRASIPSIVEDDDDEVDASAAAAAAAAAAVAAACLLVGGEGNNWTVGHWDLLRATAVGGVDGGAGAGLTFSLFSSFFFLLL